MAAIEPSMGSGARMTACDLVRIAFDRLDAGDVEGTLALFHPEVVVINPPAIGLGVMLPTHMFGLDELRAGIEGVDIGKIERRIESIEEIRRWFGQLHRGTPLRSDSKRRPEPGPARRVMRGSETLGSAHDPATDAMTNQMV